jgi:hypothetical protein
MQKSVNTAVSMLLPALVLCGASCDVYDASLSRHLESSNRRSRDSAASVEDASAGDTLDDAGESSSSECGNGTVDPDERCDIAISSGRKGACPDGCSGREGCSQRVLIGSHCAARCEETQITQAIPDDGCCPSEATAAQDNDCASTCGNGVIERGERCDPPGTCARKKACTTTEVCQQARYSGDPDSCTAACVIEPIGSCVSGDACCPPGCSAESDDDCSAAEPACAGDCPTGEGSVDGGSPDASGECQAAHTGTACDACDCEQCQAEALGCAKADGERVAERCEALSRCSVKAECTGIDCYCGNLNSDTCQLLASGPCVSEIRTLAGTRNVLELMSIGSMEDTGLGRWLQLTACRKLKCARTCGL